MEDEDPWRGIFTRRVVAPRVYSAVGDPNASLRELALRKVVESCDDAAAEVSLEELREIAGIMAQWPTGCLPWVLPRLTHRLVLVCAFEVKLQILISADLLEAAIRRDEQRFREANDSMRGAC